MELEKFFAGQVCQKIRENTDTGELVQVRIRIHSPLVLELMDREILCRDLIADENILTETFNKITGYSAYAFKENIKCGYLTVAGGHRAGFGGEVILENGRITAMKNIRFITFRFAHAIEDCGRRAVEKILQEGRIENTLIISSPAKGKTTLLRDIVKLLSHKVYGMGICVIDERNEISGSYLGIPSMDLGPHTDVICNCPKEQGIPMAVRAMSPAVIAVDEIGGEKDLDALAFASRCGVKIIATIHGNSLEDAKEKLGQAYEKLFTRKILIRNRGDYICY